MILQNNSVFYKILRHLDGFKFILQPNNTLNAMYASYKHTTATQTFNLNVVFKAGINHTNPSIIVVLMVWLGDNTTMSCTVTLLSGLVHKRYNPHSHDAHHPGLQLGHTFPEPIHSC